MKAVIVAAGMGSRLWGQNDQIPKTLMPFNNKTILATILRNIAAAGVREFVIVVGYRKELIVEYLAENDHFGYQIDLIENPEWQRGNGISVLAAEPAVNGQPFLLSMSDHLVSVSAIHQIVRHSSLKNLLLVDPRIDAVFDLDDATKVRVTGHRILDIGKEIQQYNGIDCGVFKLTPRFFEAMRERLKLQQESISAAIQGLIQKDDMEAVFMKRDDFWIDIDTPEAYHHALQIFGK
ncbi:MAG: NTP transferase domain-containing protein [candidate division KSB1 bacterium]|nr:NTP transferase domain-containing protein [candidate division KSB1 bacterium]MDZ7357649.1 NTP transferase domain-containing protein [candidate division KSB1 bacterium]MDZ7399207.1 NTP transferase domain-containing protein [candidate division KSB1 bacterium]